MSRCIGRLAGKVSHLSPPIAIRLDTELVVIQHGPQQLLGIAHCQPRASLIEVLPPLQNGKTKFTIENATKTRIVLADTKIHILGSYQSIRVARDAICSLILGSPPGKVHMSKTCVRKRCVDRSCAAGHVFSLISSLVHAVPSEF